MGVIKVPYMEMMITQACTLRCEGCAVFANYAPNTHGPQNIYHVDFDEAKEGLIQWSKRVQPETFSILGGEPTLHKDLFKFMELISQIWPNTVRQIVTNGTLLQNHPELPEQLQKTNTQVRMSFHSSDPKYLRRIKKPIQLLQNWANVYKIHVEIVDSRKFWRGYLGEGQQMRPFNYGNPTSSWNSCPAKRCKNFYNNRLWKCAQIRSLKPILEFFGIADAPEWQPYLHYNGIGLEATDAELNHFLNASAEPICGMCPVSLDYYHKKVYHQQSADVFTESEENPMNLSQLISYVNNLPDQDRLPLNEK